MSCFLSVIFGVIKYSLNDRFGRAGMGIFGAYTDILISSKIRLLKNRHEEGNIQSIRLTDEALGIRHITIQPEMSASDCTNNHRIDFLEALSFPGL